MSVEEYAEGMLLAYCGEVRGETTFTAMAEHEPDPVARQMWSKVAEVEALTGAILAPIARRLHGPVGAETRAARTEGRTRAAERRGVEWRRIAEAYEPDLPVFLARFEALEALGPLEDRAALSQLTAHSRAFGDCIRAWLGGDAAGALGHLQSYLDRYRR